MPSPEATEILHHALIGGAVAFVLSLSDIIRVEVIEKRVPVQELPWRLYALPVAIFAVGFVVILAFEWWWHRTTPVRLKDIDGYVDGTWIYAMRDVGSRDPRFTRGSVMILKSSGLGLKLSGWSYSYEELKHSQNLLGLTPSGNFIGHGSPWTGNSIYYCYDGGELSQGDRGVGYYSFFGLRNIELGGSFTGYNLGSGTQPTVSRLLKGRRINPNEQRIFDIDNGKTLLLGLLDEYSQNNEPPHKFPGVGEVDEWTQVQQLEDDPNREIASIGEFIANGRPLASVIRDGIHYDYQGHEDGEDTGIGDYFFSRNPAFADELIFRGDFTSKRLGYRTVKGRKIKASEESEWQQYGGKTLLLKFMRTHVTDTSSTMP